MSTISETFNASFSRVSCLYFQIHFTPTFLFFHGVLQSFYFQKSPIANFCLFTKNVKAKQKGTPVFEMNVHYQERENEEFFMQF